MPAFIADSMLGKLAKWLRVLGFDAVYFSRIEDDELLRIARREARILLTRDTALAARARAVRCLPVESERWEDQVRQVLDVFDLHGEAAPHTRCIACNLVLKPLPKERARNLVVPYVLERGRAFALCPGCGRVFWKGSHAADMEARIGRLLEPKRGRMMEGAGAAAKKSGVRKRGG